jgi:asparagine synthase (glutamine-hydrolysing)
MCGFVAVIRPGPVTPRPILDTMRDRLAHRGPDGAVNWSKAYDVGSVSLGFRRLAVIDTRHVADQPMVSGDGRKVIVFNGEIYNYVELRDQLEGLGHRFRTRCDTEVLLQAYEEWGDAAVGRLNGMFAFLIWDEQRQEALIARDRFGEKPLFFSRLPQGGLVLGSEMKAVLAHPGVEGGLDHGMIERVLSGHLLFGVEETLFHGVSQFHAAHRMVVTAAGEVREYTRYWKPHYDRSLGELAPAELLGRFRGHLERSVSQRMRADVPLTACLSGGLDSSSLVALMAQPHRPDGVRLHSTISARFPADATIDEGPFIDMVLERTGVSGHAVSPTPAELVRDIRRLHWHHETIIPGASMYLEWAVMREARERGYTVIIDGQAGDEILAGYQIYFQAHQAELFHHGKLARVLWLGWQRDRRLRRSARLYSQAERRFSPRDGMSRDQLRPFPVHHVRAMAERYGRGDLPSPDDVGFLRFELAVNMLRTSLPANLYSGDRNSMAHSIECRYPFLDHELVDFCSGLPDWAYLKGGWGKYLLRKALPDLLPAKISWRPDKVGFMAPQDRWMRDPALRQWAEERIMDRSLEVIEGYDHDAMRRVWRAHQADEADHSGELWRWASAAELLDMQEQGEWNAQGA